MDSQTRANDLLRIATTIFGYGNKGQKSYGPQAFWTLMPTETGMGSEGQISLSWFTTVGKFCRP